MAATNLQEKLADLPDELWKKLRDQTEYAITTKDPADFAYFKFVCVDKTETGSSVLTEYHRCAGWDESGINIRDMLREVVKDILPEALIKVEFAGKDLEDHETLADIAAVYGDKVYFKAESPDKTSNISNILTRWSHYFSKLEEEIRRGEGVNLYDYAVDMLCENLQNQPLVSQWSSEIWKVLLVLRNLAKIYADKYTARVSRNAIDSTSKLIDLLHKGIEHSSPGIVYHSANILEWITYVAPAILNGQPALKQLASGLLQVADPGANFPGRVQMEAIWACGWISIASKEFGNEIFAPLKRFEEAEPDQTKKITLRSALIRSLFHVIPNESPWVVAAFSREAGSFCPLIHENKKYMPIIADYDFAKAAKNFRAYLQDNYPVIINHTPDA